MAFCTNCGYRIEEVDSFCPQCGARVENAPQTAAPASSARYVGEDGIEVVPYVPVASPVAAAPAATRQSAPAAKPAKTPQKGVAKALPFIFIGAVVLLGALIGVAALAYAVLEHGFGLPDRYADHDGDAFEYVIFMKKWGESWAEERTDGEIVPPYVDVYEESIANGEAAPVLEPDVPLAQTLAEAVSGARTSARINMPSNWYGWVEFANWWGNDEPDSLIDAWGTADTNGEMDYFEVYVDDVDTAFYSVYMKLIHDETTILPVVDGGDSWVGDRYIQPGEEEIYRLDLLDDGMLCAEFEFVGASGECGCDVRMCFREHGQLWNEYEDRLPPRYEEYLEVLAKEAAQQAAGNENPAELPEGDGILSLEQLQTAFDWLDENGSGSTLEEIESHFGVPGAPNTVEDDFRSYRWQTADGSERVLVSFKRKDGKWVYSGMSWSNGLKK